MGARAGGRTDGRREGEIEGLRASCVYDCSMLIIIIAVDRLTVGGRLNWFSQCFPLAGGGCDVPTRADMTMGQR